MNEIISTLERTKEKAAAKLVAVRAFPIYTEHLDYRAVFEMAFDHLKDTIHLFRHARELKQKVEADRKQPKADKPFTIDGRGLGSINGGFPKRKEQDAPD